MGFKSWLKTQYQQQFISWLIYFYPHFYPHTAYMNRNSYCEVLAGILDIKGPAPKDFSAKPDPTVPPPPAFSFGTIDSYLLTNLLE